MPTLKAMGNFPSETTILPQEWQFPQSKLEAYLARFAPQEEPLINRKFAAVAIAAGLMFSASACSFNPNPESLKSYAPSDGAGADINLGDGQGLKLRNFVYLTDGTEGALIGVIANSGSQPQTITVNYTPAGEAAQSESVTVPALTTYSFGFNGNPASQLTLAGKPGDLAELSFGAGNNSEWVKLSIPVLDSTFAYYSDIVKDIPGFLNTPVVCVTASPTDTPADNAGSTEGEELPAVDCVNPVAEATN
jgi:hypothetical protein